MRDEDIKVKEINSDSALNCRGDIAPIDVHGLAQDIKENGLMMPIIVMIYTDEEAKTHGKKYRLIAGFRRYAAHKLIKQELISASIREPMTEMDSRIFNLNENIQREDLNIKQEAKALKILKDLGMNRDEAARKLGKSPGWVQIRFMLLALPEVI